MVISIVMRKTSVSDRGQWQSRLEAELPAILALLTGERGFAGVEYLWGAQGDGQMAQVTRWETLEDCHRYVRGGAAATLALQEDRALPTAPYPDGAWHRRTFEVVASG